MSKLRFFLISWLLILLPGAVTVFAQLETGTILGILTDESGGVVPNAAITIRNIDTGAMRSLTSNAEGLYSAPALPAGQYVVHVEVQGFRSFEQSAEVQAGSTTTVNPKMSVGATREVVTVEAAGAQINYESHVVQGVIARENIQELPLNGRSYMNLAQLEPGVTVAVAGVNQGFVPTILGGAAGKVHYMVDGVGIDDAISGGVAMNLSQEVVQEFQISLVNFDVSTGITSTGAINIVSRSGGNEIHGSAYFFYRDHNMAAYPNLKRSLINPSPFFARRNPGAWLSGPIIKNKLFAFYNYERTNQTNAVTYAPDLASIQAIGGVFSSPYIQDLQDARVDYHRSDKNNMFFRFAHEGNLNKGLYSSATALNPSSWVHNRNQDDDAVAGLTTIVTPSIVNDARLAYFFWHYDNEQTTPSECVAPCIGGGLPPINGMVGSSNFAVGAHPGMPQIFTQRRGELSDVLVWQKGAHRLKFGGDYTMETTLNRWQWCTPFCESTYSPTSVLSAVGAAEVAQYFPTLPTKITNNADVLNLPISSNSPLIQSAGLPFGCPYAPCIYNKDKEAWSNRPHLFAQDVWKVNSHLTVNYGIAYQISFGLFNSDIPLPNFLAPIFGANNLGGTKTNLNNIAPALGFAWSPGKDGKTVIRGGVGEYWDANILNNRAQSLGSPSPLGNGYIGFGAQVLTNTFPGIVTFNGSTPVPLPIGANLPVSGSNTLSNLTVGQFIQLYNNQAPALRQQFGGGPLAGCATPTGPCGGGVLSTTVPTSGAFTVSGIDVAKQGVSIMPEHFPLTRSYQISIGVQRDLGHDMVITADYVRKMFFNIGDNALDYNHYNEFVNGVRTPVIPSCGAVPNYTPGVECSNGAITVLTDEGRSVYNGLLVKLNKRFSNRFQFTASYAYQHNDSIGSYFNLNNYFQGYGDTLANQNLNVAGLVRLPWGFEVTMNASAISVTPFNAIMSGIDLTGTSGTANPIPGIPYGCLANGCGQAQLAAAVTAFNATYAGQKTPSGTKIPTYVLPPTYAFGSPIFTQDFRVTKTFTYKERYKLNIFGEVFNAFNIANHTGYSGNLDTQNANPAAQTYAFGRATLDVGQTFGSGGPRAIQIGGRLLF